MRIRFHKGISYINRPRSIALFVGILILSALILSRWNSYDSHTGVQQERIKGSIQSFEFIPKQEFEAYQRQKLSVSIHEDGKRREVPVEYNIDDFSQTPMKKGDQILLTKTVISEGNTLYAVTDRFRINRLLLIIAGFLLFVFFAAGRKGIGSIFGLFVSVAVIMFYIIPSIVRGHEPLMTCVIGAVVIMLVSIYPAHGISRQTTVAIIAAVFSLIITVVLAKLLFTFMLLTGFGAEEAFAVKELGSNITNIKGLLIGGILIATLGALDDVTTAQSAAVFELGEANRNYSFNELINKAYRIGREHVVSLINTLVIVYVGSSLAVFLYYHLLFAQNPQPLLLILNKEFAVEEIVKTIAISTGLILSVPVVTVLAAMVVKKKIWFPEKRHFNFLLHTLKRS